MAKRKKKTKPLTLKNVNPVKIEENALKKAAASVEEDKSPDKSEYDFEEQKKSFEELEITDGKDREAEKELKEHKKLEKLLGVNQINPYGTYSEKIFKDNLEHMTREDLMSLAMRVGVTPTRDKIRIKKNLLDSFKSFSAHSGTSIPQEEKPLVKKGDKDYHKVRKLFEG